MKKKNKQKYYFSSTETLDAWTGSYGYYNLIIKWEFLGFRICFWRTHKNGYYGGSCDLIKDETKDKI